MRVYQRFKRIFEFIASLIGVIILMPIFFLLGMWIKLSSKGPIIYKHPRVGLFGNEFTIYKFRSMVVGARDKQKKGVSTEKLITAPGRFMRRTFFDEFLQLFNILKGDIGLIGPRPMDVEYFDGIVKKDPDYKNLLSVRPGLTSLESIIDYLPKGEQKRFEEHFEGLVKKDKFKDFEHHRYALDSYYIKHESLILDIKIIFYTFILMLRRLFSKK